MSKTLFVCFLVAVLTLARGNELDESTGGALSIVANPNLVCNDDGTYIICKRLTSADYEQMSKNGSVVTHKLEVHARFMGGVIDRTFGEISQAIQSIIGLLQNMEGFISNIPQEVFNFLQGQFHVILKWAGILYVFVLFGFILAAFPVVIWNKLTARRTNGYEEMAR